MYSYINTRGNGRTPKVVRIHTCGCGVSTQFVVFPISTRADIAHVYRHRKSFLFLDTVLQTKKKPAQRGFFHLNELQSKSIRIGCSH